jgi:23S rRNA (cytosine1962-C5)-methyltransferase
MMHPVLLQAQWKDYVLIDCGNGEKLERYGKYVLRRPEPQAIWPAKLTESEWSQKAHATYVRTKGRDEKLLNSERGEWKCKPGMPESWYVAYQVDGDLIKIRLALTAFGHIGVFPEQQANWDFIEQQLSGKPGQNFLNLFGYTGVASLVAKKMGADVVHVDSIRQTIHWAGMNQTESSLSGIRWVVEDALKFVTREARRGNKYNGIILDPPAYGRGPDGEKWVFQQDIPKLMHELSKILKPENAFLVLNTYSMGHSPVSISNLLHSYLNASQVEFGELVLYSETEIKLPLSSFARITRK